jgi:hypothetical protein
MMEENKINEEQLSQAAGGDGDRGRYKPIRTRACVRCGREFDALFLDTHGGMCKSCVFSMCPVCGGEMKIVPRTGTQEPIIVGQGGKLTLQCVNCGATKEVD